MTIKLTRLDLSFILTQIEMAEADQTPVNPLLSFGLREVAEGDRHAVAHADVGAHQATGREQGAVDDDQVEVVTHGAPSRFTERGEDIAAGGTTQDMTPVPQGIEQQQPHRVAVTVRRQDETLDGLDLAAVTVLPF